MELFIHMPLTMAALGWALITWLLGGGVSGAVLVFIVAKLLGR